jgi:uncharacterized protein (UPF0264 family)
MKILVSVRDVAEAELAAAAGVGFIDLKEPSDGALGGLPVEAIRPIVQRLRRVAPGVPVTATIGDWPAHALAAIRERVLAVAACGVDHVKVGVVPGIGSSALVSALGWMASSGVPVVPVLIADDGVPADLLDRIARQRFAAVMLDTADKRGGTLLQRVPPAALAGMIEQVRRHGGLAGLAGALRFEDLPALQALDPDFAGFRSAVCAGDRRLGIDDARLRRLVGTVADQAFDRPRTPATRGARPSSSARSSSSW